MKVYLGYGAWRCPSCRGIMEYVYANWWRCRDCQRWRER